MKKSNLLILCFAMLLAGCGNTASNSGNNEGGHEHVYSSTWSYNETTHWHECSCGDKKDEASHIFDEWVEDKAATTTEKGSKHRNCTVCPYVQVEEIPLIEDDDPFVIDDSIIQSMTLTERQIIVEKGKRYPALIVDFVPSELTLEQKEVTWNSEDESIATVDQYGRVSGVEVGKTIVTVTSNISNHQDRCVVYVVLSKEDIETEYQRVDDVTTLKNNDIIVIAAPKDNKVASLDHTGSYLHATDTTFSSDKSVITRLGNDAAEFILGDKEERGFTLESQEGAYFAGFNLERVGFVNSKGNIDWHFTQENGELYIETHNDVRGWIMFNKDLDSHNGGFTLYERETSNEYVYTPTIYRLTMILDE